MIKLIKNELIKIFKKKNILIILTITFAFTFLNNIIYKNVNINFEDTFEKQYIKQIKEDIKNLNPNNPSERDEYIAILSDIEVYELKQKYKDNSWQRKIIEKDVDGIIRELNTLKYNNNNNNYQNQKKEYDKIINYLNNKSWKDYTRYLLDKKETELSENTKLLNNATTKADKALYKEINNIILDDIYRLNIRLEKDIIFRDDYLNDAVEKYRNTFTVSLSEYLEEQKDNLKGNYDEQEIKNIYSGLVTQNEQAKYMIENKIDLNNQKSLRYGLINTLSNNTIFILVITVMIAGTIVSGEFDKGTIKLLLVRPYKRTKILLSKFIVSLIMLIFAICSVYIFELLIGGIFFGIKGLDVPIIIYNITTDKVLHIGLFKYIIDMILTTLPQYILLLTLSFTISTIINNSAVAIAIPLIGSFVAEIINALIGTFKIEFLKYFVTLHWDLSQYLYGAPIQYKGFSLQLSILICMIYFIIMIIPTFIVFKKKNIKNI